MVSIDPTSGAVTNIGGTHGTGVFGALMGACNGVFGIANNGGFYQIDVTNGVRTSLANTPSALAGVDGAHCHTACINTTPLPVSLISFDAYKKGNTVDLLWATASEKNNSGFDVERSADGNLWTKLGTVNSKAENGSSNVKLEYDFTDHNPLAGKNQYRLKQIDFDGAFEYSRVTTVNFTTANSILIYPNPAKEELIVDGLAQNGSIRIYNTLGQELNSKAVKSTEKQVRLNVSNLSDGVYYLVVTSEDEKVIIRQKFVKQ